MGEEVGAAGRIVVTVAFWVLTLVSIALLGALAWAPRYVSLRRMELRSAALVDANDRLEGRVGELRVEADALKGDAFAVESVLRREMRVAPEGEEVMRVEVMSTDNAVGGVRPAPGVDRLEVLMRPFALDRGFRGTMFIMAFVMLVCAFGVAGGGSYLRARADRLVHGRP